MILLSGLLFALSPADQPFATTANLPATGVTLLRPGADLVSAEPQSLAQRVLITNGAGEDVPFLVLLTPPASDREEQRLSARPLGDNLWQVSAADRRCDSLELDFYDLSAGPLLVAVDEWGPTGAQPAAGRTALYEVEINGSAVVNHRVPVHSAGPFVVQLVGLRSDRLRTVSCIRLAPDAVPPRRQTVSVGPPVLDEEGKAIYSLELPFPQRIRSIELEIAGDLFDRAASVRLPGESYGEGRQIRRVQIAGTAVDRTTLEDLDIAAERLELVVDTDRGEPLEITAATVLSVDAALILRDPGDGPHTVYTGTDQLDRAYDLDIARAELFALASQEVPLGPLSANPDWLPIPSRESVDGPGPTLNLVRYRYEREIVADPGWSRLILDGAVRAHSRRDQQDLRIIDQDGAQIPFILTPSSRETEAVRLKPEATQEGRYTLLRVPLPGPEFVVERVTLGTSRQIFERRVEIVQDRGAYSGTVRSVLWSGGREGSRIGISVRQPLGAELLIRIDNADNAPIVVDEVVVTQSTDELRFRQPAGSTRLVYGDRLATAPQWDLHTLRSEVLVLPTRGGTLGPERPLVPPVRSELEVGATWGSVGLLVVGLMLMALRVFFKAAPEEEPQTQA